jgi:hypothetical protein
MVIEWNSTRGQVLIHAGLIIGYLVLALAVLWPLPLHFDDTIIGLAGDPLLQTWALCWNAHWLGGGVESYFDANISYPEKTTFAFHDPLFAQSLVFFPIWLVSGNPIFGYNLLILLTYVLGGWGNYLCGRALGLSALAAFSAGLLYAFCPIRLNQLVHLNILSTQWIPFCVLALLMLIRQQEGSRQQTIGFTLFSLLGILSSFYHASAWGLLVAVICIGSLIKRLLSWHHMIQLVCSALIIVAVLSPFVGALFRVSERYNERRSIGENIKNSAELVDYAVAAKFSLIYGPLMRWLPLNPSVHRRSGEKSLFPGLVMVLLAGVGCRVVLRRHARPESIAMVESSNGRIRGPTLIEWRLLLVAGILGLIFSLGPAIGWTGSGSDALLPMPYWLIYEFVPGVQGLRVPARIVVVAVFVGSLMAGLGLDHARRNNSRLAGFWLAIILLALGFSEGLAQHDWMTTIPTGDQVPEVYQDIAEMADDTVLLELPTHTEQFYPMYFSTYHFRKLANGRSAFIPPTTKKLISLTDPKLPYAFGPALLDHLLENGVNTILVKRSRMSRLDRRLILRRLNRLRCLTPIQIYPNRDILYRLDATGGDRSDVKPISRRRFERGKQRPIELPGEDAFPVNAVRPMRQTAHEGALRLFESNHVRWRIKIPEGFWHLTMVARNADHPKNAGQPVILNVQIAELPVLEYSTKEKEVELTSRPLYISKEEHYAIDCRILHQPSYASMRLELDKIQLISIE